MLAGICFSNPGEDANIEPIFEDPVNIASADPLPGFNVDGL
jgi:hypothetical protein